MNERNEFDQIVGHSVIDWTPCLLPNLTKQHGRFCSVEPLLVDTHGPELFDVLCVNNEPSWTYLPKEYFKTYSSFKAWLDSELSRPDQRFYTIVDKKRRQAVGMCAYLRINPDHGVIEIGCINFAPFLKQTPAATESMYLMMCHAFDDLGYRRYEWKCNNLNEASKKAALRLGFKFEGVFRQSNVFKNRNRDTAWFSILDNEWPDIKTRLQRWLSHDNFDVDGQQIKRLSDINHR